MNWSEFVDWAMQEYGLTEEEIEHIDAGGGFDGMYDDEYSSDFDPDSIDHDPNDDYLDVPY